MGVDVEKVRFSAAEAAAFAAKLRVDVEALARLLARPGFGAGAPSIGAELEMFLVDARGRPLPIGREVIAESFGRDLALELDRFNLEYNAPPVRFRGRPFAALADHVRAALRNVAGAAASLGGQPALVGILPTLTHEDLGARAITELKRFQALATGIRRARGGDFAIDIHGTETLRMDCEEVTLEGANTAFQLHLRVDPERFADMFNAAQLATAPVLALSTNSPIFLGCKLWEETRVALFRQAVDERHPDASWLPARVSFGHGWVREGALELFAECVALHPPLLPQGTNEDPLAIVDAGGVPALHELRLHAGTVWSWNRAVFDDSDGGHLRIEMRALPAGPTVIDMVASAAFLVGLTLGLARDIRAILPSLPFRYAEENFYAAAQFGLDAEMFWPAANAPSPRRVALAELMPELLEIAGNGLVDASVDHDEAERLLALCRARWTARMTGARWQRQVLDRLECEASRSDALASMFQRYQELSMADAPVHTWPREL